MPEARRGAARLVGVEASEAYGVAHGINQSIGASTSRASRVLAAAGLESDDGGARVVPRE